MTRIPVVGELDAKGENIVIIPLATNDYDIAEIDSILAFITPERQRVTDKRVHGQPSPWKVHLSWEAVTQVRNSFPDWGSFEWVTGPRLSAWIFEEIIRRSCQGDLKGDKPAREPMPHQSAGAIAIGMNGKFLLADEPGAGKTTAALMGLAELEPRNRNPWPVIVVCPASVVDPWMEEIAAVYPRWHGIPYRGKNRSRFLYTDRRSRDRLLLIMSYETMRIDMGDAGSKSPLEKFRAGTLILDEAHKLCLAYDSGIQTPGGVKRICDIREGELVRGVDHTTGGSVWSRVRKVSRSRLRPTVRLDNLELTPDHPVWVSDSGYVGYAVSYDEDLYLSPLQQRVHAKVVPELARASILREGVRASVAGYGRGVQREAAREHGEGEYVRCCASVPEFRKESVPGGVRPGDPETRDRHEQGAWVSGANGRERGAYYPAGDVAASIQLGVHPRMLSKPWSAPAGIPYVLQGGPRLPAVEAGDRTGREFASLEATSGAGSEEGSEAGFTWLDGASVLERGSPERSLWNLSTDTGNYVAAGILVHNCNVDTKQSVRARRLARHIPNVVCATGTPITKNVGNFFPILSAMYPYAYPHEQRYKDRYTLDKGSNKPEYGEKPGGLDPLREPEFRDVMRGTMRRVAKADVMKDLPPKTYQTRWVDIPPKWRAAYEEMEEDMLAHVPDCPTPMEAMSTLAKMTRLRQLANSACDVTIKELDELDEITGQPKQEMIVTPKMPCWKGDALLEILAERHQDDEGKGIQHGHRPVIAFAPFRTIVMLAGQMAEAKGYRTGYIVGGMTDKQRTAARLAFEDHQLDLICVSTGAGGTGLTLVAADTVVFLARPWSYVEATQAEDRAHRRGQTKNVMIIDLVARDSVESRVREALKGKARNLAELVQDRRLVEEFLGGH